MPKRVLCWCWRKRWKGVNLTTMIASVVIAIETRR